MPCCCCWEGQEIAARNYYRPRNQAIAAKYARQFPKVELFTIDQMFGGWAKAQKEHFSDGGIFDQISGVRPISRPCATRWPLTKPFSPRTLSARVRALLRRSGGTEKPAPLSAGDFLLNLERQAVILNGRDPARLTKLEFRLLQLLLANAGHILPSERLLRHVWGNRASDDRQLLKQLVHRLRLKIEPDVTEPRYLVTVSGVGYALRPTGEDT